MNLKHGDFSTESPRKDALAELALDLRWSWNHSTDKLWREMDPELWDLTQNPWVVLQTVSRERLERLAADPGFLEMLDELMAARRADAELQRWFEKAHPNSPLKTVAYFSMEYMLSEALPIYSGGLGNVAGDQLKAANDLGVPVIAVGLLYQQGYFRQEIDRNGTQRALYPYNDPGQLPIKPLRDANGDWLRLPIALPGFKLWIRSWEVQVGNTKLYLLDTNDPANLPEYRGITSELYGGGPDLRLKQELVLGIGGWRLLRSLKIEPEVCHLNEGHAAFAILERAASYMEDTGSSFQVALSVTRVGNLFTTHTAVEAGFDRFSDDLMRTHLSRYAQDRLHIRFEDIMALGRQNAGDLHEPFNMAYLAIRGSGAVNGVSRLHGAVSRQLFQPLFSRWPREEVPVGYVTNGVHVPTWDSVEADRFWTNVCGKGCWREKPADLGTGIYGATDAEIWRLRGEARASLVEYIRDRYSRQIAIRGGSASEIAEASQVFGLNTLTLGFARRFATYKRPNLLLHDPERLMRILSNPQHPVQLVIAGKAHPQDAPGQAMIKQWFEFIQRTGVRSPVIFLSDYDMHLTERLVGGVDVWVNTPRRPWEASGTSGMKVLVNGGLNVSELDGWWAEAYSPEVGWALGDGNEHGEDPSWDAKEAEDLYTLLEREIVPEFYDWDGAGIPKKWVSRMRESMARLTPVFSAHRTVREYTENFYIPAATGYAKRAADGGKLGQDLVTWEDNLNKQWQAVRFGPLNVKQQDNCNRFEVSVYFGGLDPNSVRVELYAAGQNGSDPDLKPMDRGAALPDGGFVFSACAATTRNAHDFTPRVVPNHPGASIPLEANRILWPQ